MTVKRKCHAAHQQQQLLLPEPKRHGGKRRGAGRKPAKPRPGTPHTKRAAVTSRYPVHVVLRVSSEIGNLRRKAAYEAVRTATLVAGQIDDFRLVQISLQHTHIHLIVEAASAQVLAKAMQAFQISAAKQLNAATSAGLPARRRGRVFVDRYHATTITTPTQARHTMAYVTCNWRKHREDLIGDARYWKIDWYSSAIAFTGWREYEGGVMLWRGHKDYEPLFVRQPQSWLLRVGWKLAGEISYWDVPGGKA